MKLHRGRASSTGQATRRGSVLVLSLIAVATVVVLSASFSQFASAVADRQTQAVDKKRAFYLAEAGLAESFAGYTCGKSGNVGTRETPALLGSGVFWVQATELQPGIASLEATGMVGSGEARLTLVARRGVEGVCGLGVFSGGQVTLGAGSLVDAYDSTLGTYASQADKTGAAIGSNGAISLAGTSLKPTTIKGDVTPGVDHSVNTLGNVSITGSTTPALAQTELPDVDVPALSLGAAQNQSSPYPLVIPAGNVGYESLTVQSGSEVIIQGPADVVLGSLSLKASAQLSFDTSQGAIHLYVLNAVDLVAGSIVTTSSTHPEDVLIQVPELTAAPVSFKGTGSFNGVIYAPKTQVTIASTFEVFGAVVADRLAFTGAAKLHIDKNLAKIAAEDALPVMLSWRLVELSSLSSDLSVDPFDYLGVAPSALPAPSGAHADQTLYIDYLDASLVYHRYDGPESSFDWNVVGTLIYATRDGVEVMFPRAPAKKAGTIKSPGVLPVIDGPMI